MDEEETSEENTTTPLNGRPNPLRRLVQLGDRKLGDWGLRLNQHPSLQFAFFILLPVAEFLFGFLGGPTWLLYEIYPESAAPNQIAHVAAADLLLNVSFALAAPLFTGLLTASLMVYGQIAHADDVKKGQYASTQQSTSLIARAVDDIGSEVTQRLNQAQLSLTRDIHSHLESLAPGWMVAASDPVIRHHLSKIARAVGDALQQTNDEHRVIVRSLFRGLGDRFTAILSDLPDKGSFMEPSERRKLTEELFNSTKSYHVVFCGMHPILSGDWLWHPGYQRFLQDAQRRHRDNVSWTFIDLGDHNAERERAIADVLSFGVRCFVFKMSGNTGDLGATAFNRLLERGPLIEVFGRDFPTADQQAVEPGAFLTWKATSLKIRTSHSAYEPWTTDSSIRPPPGEGVWGADNIDKLVRAGVINNDQSLEFQVLDNICRHRRRVKAYGAMRASRTKSAKT